MKRCMRITLALLLLAMLTGMLPALAENPVVDMTAWEIWLERKPAEGTFDPRVGPMAETIRLKVVAPMDNASGVDDGITVENGLWNDIIKDQLNIEFDYLWVVPSDQWNQRFQLSISAGEIPDLIRMDEKQFRNFAGTGSLRDLTSAYNEFAIDELHEMDAKFNDAPIKQAMVDGQLLAIPRYEDNHASVCVLWYRKDWADELGIGAPQDVYELMDMAAAFGNDPNHPERTGLIAQKDPYSDTYSFGGLFQAFGAYPKMWILKDGQVVPGMIQDEVLTGLQAAKTLYEKGAVNKDFAAFGWDQAVEKLTNSTAGIAFGKWWAPDAPLAANLEYDNAADWALAPLPGMTAGVPGNSIITENMVAFYNGVYVNAPKGAEEALMRLLNFYWCRVFPAKNETWPQPPLPTEEERLLNIEKDKITLAKGLYWNWTPALTWNATENSDRARIVNAVLNTGDTSLLRNANDKGWYDDSKLWVEKGLDDENYKVNWRTYASRGMDDSGVLLTTRMREEGHVVYNVFYGGATETENDVSSTLSDLANEFAIKFITGGVDESAWPDFKDEWLSLGGQDWWDEVVEAYNAIH